MPPSASIQQLLSLLPESQLDHFLRQLSPEAVQALKSLEASAPQPTDAVSTEIANALTTPQR